MSLSSERGYSLIEMLIVMTIMGLVMGGITSLFVAGSNAEIDQNNRFQTQQAARVSLDKIRREVHCAQSITLNGTASGSNYPAMTESPTACNGVQYTWCTAAVNASTTRFRLYRISGTWPGSCTGGVQYADYVIRGPLFSYNNTTSGSLPKLTVDLPVNVQPTTKSFEIYELKDDIVLRNATRTP